MLAREFPATLTLQFPAAADVWLDGKKVEGSAAEERVLTSPTLKPGEDYTFALKARWTADGKTYEATRSVKVGPGDRSRLFDRLGTGSEIKPDTETRGQGSKETKTGIVFSPCLLVPVSPCLSTFGHFA